MAFQVNWDIKDVAFPVYLRSSNNSHITSRPEGREGRRHCSSLGGKCALHFAGKIAQIRSDLDAVVDTDAVNFMPLPCPVLMDDFQFMQSQDGGEVKANTCLFKPCPS